MTQHRRPTAEPRTPFAGFDESERQPLARVAPAAPRQGWQGQARPRQAPAAPAPAEPVVGGEMQLSFGMIVVSLPVAFSFGQMLIDKNLNALPQMVGWTALVLAYQGITAPGVARGFLDWTGDAVALGPELRERLGIPEALPRVAPHPRTRGIVGWTDGLVADVRNLRAAVAARRGEVIEGVLAPDAPNALMSRAGALAWPARAGWDEADGAAVDALDDADAPPDIGLPVVRLEDIANLDNLWVVGPKNSGKTTVLRRLLELRRGTHWALDPHNTPGKWPSCTVVGGGMDFDAINLQIDKAYGWMRRRYQNMDKGTVTEAQCSAARRTLVGDEWRAIRSALPGSKGVPSAAARLLDILSQGRKAGICALAASHLDTAEGMGISGEKDMLKCFDMIIYLGAMATKYVPTAARMARPAVVYDPVYEVWAQLIIALPTPPSVDVREDDEEEAPEASPTPVPAPAAPAVAPTAAPPSYKELSTAHEPALMDDLLTGLLAGVGAPPAPSFAPDLSTVSPTRAARLAAILGRQAAAPAAAPAPVAIVAPVAPAVGVAPVSADAPAIALAQDGPPSTTNQRVAVDQPGGGKVYVYVNQQVGRATSARQRREGALATRDRRRRLGRIAYYTQAATNGIPFTRAYQNAPPEIGKGNSNEMHAVYQTAKAKRGNSSS